MVAVFRPLIYIALAFMSVSGVAQAASGIVDLAGNGLDGDGNGSAGGTYVSTFRVNAAPDGGADIFAVDEDGALTNKSVLTNDSDAHGGLAGENNLPLSVELIEAPGKAQQFALRTEGSFDYRPGQDFNGSDHFKYVVKDSFGAASQPVNVTLQVGALNDAPLALIDASPLEVFINEPVYLDGSGSSDVDGDALSFAWNFGDGSTAGDTKVLHSYSTPGRYLVTLTASDPSGATGQASVEVVVREPEVGASNQDPKAKYSLDLSLGVAPLSVNFDGSASFDPDGTIRSYRWDFDDGTVLVGSLVSRIFSSPGVKAGTLTVFDDQGASGTVGFRVVVLNDAIDGVSAGDAPSAALRFRSVFRASNRDSVMVRFTKLVMEPGDSLVLLVGENMWGRLFADDLNRPNLIFEPKGKRAGFNVKSGNERLHALALPGGRLDVRIFRSEFSDSLDFRGLGDEEARGGQGPVGVRLIRTRADGEMIFYHFSIPTAYKVRLRGPKGQKTTVSIQGRPQK